MITGDAHVLSIVLLGLVRAVDDFSFLSFDVVWVFLKDVLILLPERNSLVRTGALCWNNHLNLRGFLLRFFGVLTLCVNKLPKQGCDFGLFAPLLLFILDVVVQKVLIDIRRRARRLLASQNWETGRFLEKETHERGVRALLLSN